MIVLRIILLLILLSNLNNVLAQSNLSLAEIPISLNGRVFDVNGAVIPNIKITAHNLEKKIYESRTNENGTYVLSLPVGIYSLEINSQNIRFNGFETIKIENYRVVPSNDGKMNFDVSLPVYGDGVICRLTVVSEGSEKLSKTKKVKPRKKD